ncbi:MAG TPA: prolyl oligopeptidase family serine peptidase [Terriglobales bacterium]|nr:prolyl oligopeptidase family serine peptidase [Terriglobales bacterium]
MFKRAQTFSASLILATLVWAQGAPPASAPVFKPGDNLVTQGIPPVPMSVVQQADRYTETRGASLFDWEPTKREMLIGTRFGDTVQVHWVKMPGGARKQMTFFPDRVAGAAFQPRSGKYFVIHKDVGGGEWFQYYRYDVGSGDITLLTDGKSRNLAAVFSHAGDRMAYTSTRRTGQDTDLWVIDPRDPKSDRMLLQLQGGGWGPTKWSPDDTKILLTEFISANESKLWLVDVAAATKTLLLDGSAGKEKVFYGPATFSHDAKGIYLTTDKDSEFHRLAYCDLASKQLTYLTTSIPWDIEEYDLSEDGRTIAFAANQNGTSVLHFLDTATRKEKPAPKLPAGVISGLKWHPNNRDVGFALSWAQAPADVYSVDVQTGVLSRWTESETGGLNAGNFAVPELITWKSFDGLSMSGYLYKPPAKFGGKRPVIVNIHGGPEGQSRPSFIGLNNYYLNELGVAIVYPNVRGSTGYGKTFLAKDNGTLREDTYKDIGALLDWIKQQPGLDPDKVMITGGSYGGHMTYAVAYYYSDRICCSLPVVGITSLVTLLEHTEAYRRDLRRVEYGDERDPKMREYLTRIAPMSNAQKIQKPLFAVVGKNDPRVPYSESVQILDKIRANGVPVWFLLANDEGHGYAKKKNRDFQFYATIMFVRRFLLGEQAAD